ncbi:MAG: hypothetical protein O2816_10915 [Planctomycetota bacterium]|nr:hypothetical protein [Planctomycetota bacterium]
MLADELRRFRDALERATSTLEGVADLQNIEDAVRVRVTMTGHGHANVVVELRQWLAADARLRLEFETDQTFLDQTVRQLRELCAAIPG